MELAFEKSDLGNDHTITSNQVLCCTDTGRVMAVFYNDYDLDCILNELKNDKAEIVVLKKMIDNGIGWADLEDDSKPW